MESIPGTMQQLGRMLRGKRKSRGVTQAQLGAAAGLLPKTVSLLERDPGRCRVDTLFTVLSALDLEMALRPKPQASLPHGAAEPGW